MKGNISKVRLISLFNLVSLFVVISYFGCQKGNPFVHTKISEHVFIDSQEREFIFDQPFKPKKMINKVCFEYTDSLKPDKSGTKFPEFSDGTQLKLKAFVIDQNGKRYELNNIENAFDNYICVLPESESWRDISKTDTVFVKLLVHSNKKLNLSKIQWVSYNIWDI
jgi:hypothetical protein